MDRRGHDRLAAIAGPGGTGEARSRAGREASNPIATVPVRNGPEVQAEEKAEPAAAKVVSGVVRDKDGNPVADVMIKGTERYQEIRFDNGLIDDFVRHDRLYAESGSDGRYAFQGASMKRAFPPIKEFDVFAYHEKG